MKTTKTYSIDEKIYQEFDELSKKYFINKSSFFEEKILDFIRENRDETIKSFIYMYHTPERRLKKWTPITDALKVTDEKIKQIICDYAEYHQFQIHLNEFKEKMGFIELDSNQQNLVPISCKILSQLNLKNKNVIFKEDDGIPTLSFYVDVDREQIKAIKEAKDLQIVQQLEKILIDKLVEYINKELETKNNLYITTIVQSIYLISTEEFTPKMYLTSRIHIE